MSYRDYYYLPASVDEALATLARYDGAARAVAGGTDLLLELQQGRHPPVAALVDVTRIAEMTVIEQRDDYIYVGAAATHTAIACSPLLARHAACLAESCGGIGGPQVRNVATLGGNVAHALPAADGALSLLALDAEVEVASYRLSVVSCQWRPVLALYRGPGQSAVDSTRELILRFRFPAAVEGEGSAYVRVMRPQGVALPILGMAVWMQVSAGIVEEVRIALGPAGPVPLRATAAESYLTGIPLVKDVIPQIADLIFSGARLRSSKHRASAAYREELILPLARRALTLAYRRAQEAPAP